MTIISGKYACSIKNDELVVKFVPENRWEYEAQNLSISFRRTIRVPDNECTSKLPPGLGKFPLLKVHDHASRLPADMAAKGGLFFPMHQREAMWIRFRSTGPFMIKIYAGGVNVISGEHHVEGDETESRRAERTRKGESIQDYVVTPTQPWLDGIASSPGTVKQFVAMPMGEGYNVEAQLSGAEDIGGLQFEITPAIPTKLGPPPKRTGNFVIHVRTLPGKLITVPCSPSSLVGSIKTGIHQLEGIPPDQQRLIFDGKELLNGKSTPFPPSLPNNSANTIGSTLTIILRLRGGGGHELLGIAAGGKVEQNIQRDLYDASRWNETQTIAIPVQILNSAAFRQVTGRDPPHCPIDASTYAEAGLPFFKMYEEPTAIAGDFGTVKSVHEIDRERGIAKGSEKHSLSVRDPDGLMNPAGPFRPFRTLKDLQKEVTDNCDDQ
ncbi:hypothetical protein M426DRAFT_63056 [Hypoxylon sp. CI-4A]|nr:hypothetical protein M426DRAFT_63056 [Hypoxylon sp. CI-4A]